MREVQQAWVAKWNGQLPQVTSGSAITDMRQYLPVAEKK
jgi:hypothetical protein